MIRAMLVLAAAGAETLKVGGKVAGHDKITCKVVSATSAQCTATFTFATGTFSISGPIDPAKAKNTVPIVGGTGSYKGAKGALHLDFLSASRAVETYAFS